ncbi:MAG: phospholipase D family protein [Gammaproteobacteria bacterium]|nr:phospholipase D family protein [Gammaproteobacteria bacterium]
MKDKGIPSDMRARARPSWVIVFSFLLAGCNAIHAPPQPEVLRLSAPTEGTLARLNDLVAPSLGTNESAFLALDDNREALLWRLAMIDAATTSIDAQYFIWTDDEAGNLMFARCLAAADRGVRVRLLIDDYGNTTTSRALAAMSRHGHLDIKIYNPGRLRESPLGLGALGDFLLSFQQLNRRMHNKVMIVDGHAAIAGGRNIGNPYFGISPVYNFRDFGLIVVGPVVDEIAQEFDAYWNSELAFPGEYLTDGVTDADIKQIRAQRQTLLASKSELLDSYAVDISASILDLDSLPARFKTGEAHFLQDDPVNFGGEQLRLFDMISYAARQTDEELLIVSPYLIPTPDLLANLTERARDGVKIKILTGSLGSNNHTITHSHYRKYRRPLLESGATLYEFRHDPSPALRAGSDVAPIESQFISLHTKLIVFDRRQCFIGSLNLDPRGLVINTENGIFLDSPAFCGPLAEHIDMLSSAENAWRVYLNEDGQLRWESGTETLAWQPARSFGQRIADFFLGLLPIENQL